MQTYVNLVIKNNYMYVCAYVCVPLCVQEPDGIRRRHHILWNGLVRLSVSCCVCVCGGRTESNPIQEQQMLLNPASSIPSSLPYFSEKTPG